jgi:hypothetical protein
MLVTTSDGKAPVVGNSAAQVYVANRDAVTTSTGGASAYAALAVSGYTNAGTCHSLAATGPDSTNLAATCAKAETVADCLQITASYVVSGGAHKGCAWDTWVVGAASAVTRPHVYTTQMTNTKTWERYPTNHAWAMAAGSQKRFYDEAHFYSECSGKGTCDRSSGECQCFDGFSGSGCAQLACPNACSGHGVCKRLADVNSAYQGWDRQKTTQCVCDNGYTNVDCSQRICPSGDDPITRDADKFCAATVVYGSTPSATHVSGCAAYVTSATCAAASFTDNSATVTCAWEDKQAPEIMTFGHVHSLASGHVALEFTDEFGEHWTTRTLNLASSTLAADVQSALQALPNSVIQAVTVTRHTFSTSPAAVKVTGGATNSAAANFAGAAIAPQFLAVTFTTNSGDLPLLNARYSIAGAAHANNGKCFKKSGSDATEANCAAEDTSAKCGGTGGTVAADKCLWIDLTAFATGVGTHGTTGTMTALTHCADDSGENCLRADAAGDGPTGADLGSHFGADFWKKQTLTVKSHVKLTAAPVLFVTNGRKGTQENAICSNRGLCDYSTGVCKCFNGFTDDDCSKQNALAMY